MSEHTPNAAGSLPRTLVLDLLRRAQRAAPEPFHASVVADDTGHPLRVDDDPQAQPRWARVWSTPDIATPPVLTALVDGECVLVVSLGIRGVLELRRWCRHGEVLSSGELTLGEG